MKGTGRLLKGHRTRSEIVGSLGFVAKFEAVKLNYKGGTVGFSGMSIKGLKF